MIKVVALIQESAIVSKFPLDVKRKMVGEMTRYLNSNITQVSTTFTSLQHVAWVMELIGQGFSLPPDDLDIIQGCIHIYSTWLLDPQTRPPVLKQDADIQSFCQVF